MARALIFAAAAAALVAAACDNPPLQVSFGVTAGAEDACFASGSGSARATSCSQVALPCASVVSIRIFSPDNPSEPWISICDPLVGQPDLCAIAGVQLPPPSSPIPDETLEVDIAVYLASAIGTDGSGNLQCPADVEFDASGFPVAAETACATPGGCEPSPALGGRAFYHPGDASTLVPLGCVDISLVDSPTCDGGQLVAITSEVSDFSNREVVSPIDGDMLTVSVGEPRAITVGAATQYELEPADLFELGRTVEEPTPEWGGGIDAMLTSPCLEVLDDGPEATATLTCSKVDPTATHVDLPGWQLAKPALDGLLASLGAAEFPSTGLVVGLVVDEFSMPIANQVVTATAGNIIYINDAGSAGGTATGTSGVWVSTDAPFGTMFSSVMGVQSSSGFGGLVNGKVTIVVLQYGSPTSN